MEPEASFALFYSNANKVKVKVNEITVIFYKHALLYTPLINLSKLFSGVFL